MYPIALIFSDNFPSGNRVAGKCFTLNPENRQYTLGRNDDKFPIDFDINIQNRLFSRKSPGYTIYWSEAAGGWEISDSGLNADGKRVPNPHGGKVNGEWIPRLANGNPDPVFIEPGSRLWLGADDQLVYVAAECQSTISGDVSPFDCGPWGTTDDVSNGNSQQKATEKPDDTVSFNNPALEDAYTALTTARKLTRDTSDRLVDPKTRTSTAISLALIVILGGFMLFLFNVGDIRSIFSSDSVPTQVD